MLISRKRAASRLWISLPSNSKRISGRYFKGVREKDGHIYPGDDHGTVMRNGPTRGNKKEEFVDEDDYKRRCNCIILELSFA